jgi:TonB-dependent starch-binding outer membrane protein SusC
VGLAPTFPNPDLKWETTTQTNIGFDAGLVNEKYRVTFDYYIKNTSDLLALVQLPPTAGVGAGIGSGPGQIIDNVGEVQNKGWEITAGTNIINNKDWFFSLDINLSQNKNKVTKTKDNKDIPTIAGGNDASGSNSIIRVGQPLSAFLGAKFLGLDKDGLPTYENVNGDKDAGGKDIINALDNQVIGSPYPDLYYGINPTLKYKKITLSMVWTGVSGSSINNVALFELTNPVISNQYNKLRIANEFYPKPSQAAGNLHFRSSRFMEDGSFFRMRNIRLDYSFRLGKGRAIKNINVYVSGQNLITFTDYSGYDPEVNTFSGNDRRQGVDLGSYPSSKTYNVGFGITL